VGLFFVLSGADTSLVHRQPYQPARKHPEIMGELKKQLAVAFFR
jgi:hypothetical protein